MIAQCCVFPETPRSDCLCNCCWSNRLCIVIVDLSEHALRILQLTILDNTPNLEHIFVWERRFTEALIAWHHALYHHLRWSIFPSNTNRRRTVIHIHLDIDTSLTYAGTSHYSIFMRSWGTHTSFHGQLYTSRLKEFQLNFRSYRPSQEHRNLCGERMLSKCRLFAQSLHVPKESMHNHPCQIYLKNCWLCLR